MSKRAAAEVPAIFPAARQVGRCSTNLNIYLSDTLFTLSPGSLPSEIHYGPFTSDSAADSSIKPQLDDWTVESLAR